MSVSVSVSVAVSCLILGPEEEAPNYWNWTQPAAFYIYF